MARRLDYEQPDFADRFADLLASKRESDLDVSLAVAKILADVRQRGDEALLQLTAKFDRLQCGGVADLAIGQEEMRAALSGLTPALRDALQVAALRIRAFHEKQLPEAFSYRDDDGVRLGMRYAPVDAAGLYVPGGKAVYPHQC